VLKIVQDYYDNQANDPNKDDINKENDETTSQSVAKLPQDEENKLANAFNSTVLIETSNNKVKQTPKTPANRLAKLKKVTKTVEKPKAAEDKKPQTLQASSLNELKQEEKLNENPNLAPLDTTFDINNLTNSTPILNNKTATLVSKNQKSFNETLKAADKNVSPNVTRIVNVPTPKLEAANTLSGPNEANETFKVINRVTDKEISPYKQNLYQTKSEEIPTKEATKSAENENIESKSDQNNYPPKKQATGARIVRPKDQNGNEICKITINLIYKF
jgi:hypothetical protein